MIITTQKNISPEQLLPLHKHMTELGGHVCPVSWADENLLVVSGVKMKDDTLAALQELGAETAVNCTKSYKLVSREFKPQHSLVKVGNAVFGGNQIQIIAGPCSVETKEQMTTVASQAKSIGFQLMRGGAYKPRTSPYSFQGHGEHGLQLLTEAAAPHNLPVVTELMDVRDLDRFLTYGVGAIQIGTRNMQNFDLLKEVGRCNVPVILKRGMSATLSEWLMAAEYIAAGGNSQIILCERGIRTFETAYRNVLDVTGVIMAKHESHLPVIVDPSHAGGKAWMVPALSRAAIAAGADGLLIEAHPTPKAAWCDADQTLSMEELNDLVGSLDKVAKAMGRTIL